MDMELDGQFQNFNDADHGDVLIARVGSSSIVRGVKAYFPGDSSRVDQFVTLGPFTDDDNGTPGVYDPYALRALPLLNITRSCLFSVSFDPVDLLFDLPMSRQSLGLAMIGHDRVLLGVKVSRGGGSWRTMFLNVHSGEIDGAPEYTDVIASRRWRLVRPRGEKPSLVLYEFEWTVEADG